MIYYRKRYIKKSPQGSNKNIGTRKAPKKIMRIPKSENHLKTQHDRLATYESMVNGSNIKNYNPDSVAMGEDSNLFTPSYTNMKLQSPSPSGSDKIIKKFEVPKELLEENSNPGPWDPHSQRRSP
jgi:hypothetical protein